MTADTTHTERRKHKPINAQGLIRIVKRAQHGSSQAFSELYEIYFGRAYYTACKITHDENASEEIVQEVFLRVLTKLNALRDPANFEGWFFQIVSTQAQSWLREYKIKPQPDSLEAANAQDPEALAALDSEFLPEEALSTKEDRRLLLQLVDELPVAQRTAVILYYFNELSALQISKALSISAPTVNKRLFDARDSLKASFARSEQRAAQVASSTQQQPLVLTRALYEEYSASDVNAARDNTTALLAACLPSLLATPASNQTAVACARAFLKPSGLKSKTARLLTNLWRGARLAALPTKGAGVLLAATLVAGGGYAAYRGVTANRKIPAQHHAVATGSVTEGPSSVRTQNTRVVATEGQRASSGGTSPSQEASVTAASATKPTPAAPSAPARPVITIARSLLVYPRGSPPPTAAELLKAAGAAAHDGAGAQLPVLVGGLELIDFNEPGSSHVDLCATTPAGVKAKTQILTILVR
ncbi:MAG: sigma-70 family RNA polymerase sigma factor [Coriobacteriia bacterium]|nr:sigma-70 family RNA polymerase sigma factor [Coriobacteriia bacterium]